ncbi:MAG: TRAP transporter small permease [Synergistaceae bacterium]|jgi:TRAP-type C4-dicarboxylate transport system permease small subunit|nr:TRAP transporter small permease [Synergistaceae bacterium]
MKLLKFLDDKLEMVLCVALMSFMSSLLAVQVFMRYVMGNSLSWSEELARYVFIWLVYIGVSYGAKVMKHIRIEAALGLFPKKLRPYAVVAGEVIFLCFSLFICYTAGRVLQRQIRLNQVSPAMGMPLWIVYAAPMVGFGLCAVRETQNVLYRIKQLRGGGGGENHG